jgi:hypothetical protein
MTVLECASPKISICQQQREAASRLFDSNGEANRVRNKQNRAIVAEGSG